MESLIEEEVAPLALPKGVGAVIQFDDRQSGGRLGIEEHEIHVFLGDLTAMGGVPEGGWAVEDICKSRFERNAKMPKHRTPQDTVKSHFSACKQRGTGCIAGPLTGLGFHPRADATVSATDAESDDTALRGLSLTHTLLIRKAGGAESSKKTL
jgi:hypothetical protein